MRKLLLALVLTVVSCVPVQAQTKEKLPAPGKARSHEAPAAGAYASGACSTGSRAGLFSRSRTRTVERSHAIGSRLRGIFQRLGRGGRGGCG